MRIHAIILVGAGLVVPAGSAVASEGPTDAASPVVATDAGKVRGAVTDDGSAVFRGIPFAAPPVGDLRWKPPQPVEPWDDVLDTVEEAPTCPQPDQGWNAFALKSTSEDCLYLNVRTPDLSPDEPLPVMVWIHGGGNVAGGAADVIEGTIHTRGVVLVSSQYRLGALGFMAHPAFAAESAQGASGNYAFMDDQTALRWVQKNIAGFGGDPENVTIFGESAGGQHVGMQLLSPGSRGLFHRAIEESGTSNFGAATRSLKDAEEVGRLVVESAGLDRDASAEQIRALPVEKLLAAQASTQAPGGGGLFTVAQYDGAFLTSDPLDLYARGKAVQVPLIIGANAREIPFYPNADVARNVVRRTFGAHADEALAYYGLDEGGTPVSDPRLGDAAFQAATDIAFRCPVTVVSKSGVRGGARVYQYHFDHDPPGGEVSHASELGFVFAYEPGSHLDSGPLQAYWTNFARTGDPNSDGLPEWPVYDVETRPYLEFTNKGPVARERLREPVCDWLAYP
jgi:para-nitrobenzyl esterase